MKTRIGCFFAIFVICFFSASLVFSGEKVVFNKEMNGFNSGSSIATDEMIRSAKQISLQVPKGGKLYITGLENKEDNFSDELAEERAKIFAAWVMILNPDIQNVNYRAFHQSEEKWQVMTGKLAATLLKDEILKIGNPGAKQNVDQKIEKQKINPTASVKKEDSAKTLSQPMVKQSAEELGVPATLSVDEKNISKKNILANEGSLQNKVVDFFKNISKVAFVILCMAFALAGIVILIVRFARSSGSSKASVQCVNSVVSGPECDIFFNEADKSETSLDKNNQEQNETPGETKVPPEMIPERSEVSEEIEVLPETIPEQSETPEETEVTPETSQKSNEMPVLELGEAERTKEEELAEVDLEVVEPESPVPSSQEIEVELHEDQDEEGWEIEAAKLEAYVQEKANLNPETIRGLKKLQLLNKEEVSKFALVYVNELRVPIWRIGTRWCIPFYDKSGGCICGNDQDDAIKKLKNCMVSRLFGGQLTELIQNRVVRSTRDLQ